VSEARRRLPLPAASLALSAVACAALALRLAGLATPSLWHDEALEFNRAAGSWSTALFGRPIDQDPPLFALFNHVWIGFGTDEWWLRLPSALLGAGVVYLAGGWAWRRFGRRVGLLTVLFMAVAPVMVHYAQELNQYAAMVFLTMAAWIAFEGVLARRRPVDWWRFTGVSVVALATHYGMAFPLAAMGAVLTWDAWRRRERAYRGWLGLYAAACLATLAILWALGLRDRLTLPHLQARFGGTHLVKEIDYLADTLWREVAVFFTLPFSGGPALWIVGALVILAVVGGIDLWRGGPAGRRLVGVALLASLALVYPADGMGWYPLGYRWALFAAPAFCVALAAGVASLWQQARGLGIAVAAAVLAIGLLFAPQTDAGNPWLAVPREEMRAVVAELGDRAELGDTLYIYPAAEPAFRYYWDRLDIGLPRQDDPTIVWGLDFAADGADAETARIARDAQPGRQVWLVLARAGAADEAALTAALAAAGWVPAERTALPGVTLIRYSWVAAPDRTGRAEAESRRSR
jgi:4-amino-4-deoxy-L-arabinose transferase-like glycosyltransferase